MHIMFQPQLVVFRNESCRLGDGQMGWKQGRNRPKQGERCSWAPDPPENIAAGPIWQLQVLDMNRFCDS